ncbi:hypothetical protein B7R70_05325 [Yersinia pseudotuberculosis]|uniref:Uncharacterized protein n=1 Tax=Yersinia wautersii TaxID=1341643 RepID=A0ABM9TH17_9GAMM|nr:hypothetical protein BLA52_10900 [Yersinia pseudotuberculosis]CQD59146.1 Uncharacterised protein [Yersinia intermedia]CRG51189.1 Uncharacterised protein [Yersinia wautersii]PSH23627.1 hypothetical protein BLA50_18510 [Yersinia pseudotuberculosis]PSH35762.1 hypothetical protein BA197_10380 [Yersinia pseudotuberculosis]
MRDLDGLVLLERIDLIARMSVSDDMKNRDREVALVWIAELAIEAKSIYLDGAGESSLPSLR